MATVHENTLATLENKCTGRNEYVDVWEYGDKTVRWFSAIGLCDYLRRGWGRPGGTTEQSSAIAKTARLVVIDDLGTEQGTDAQTAMHSQLICESLDKFLHSGVGLIVTSNRGRSEMDARIGSRLCDLDEIELPQVDHRGMRARTREKHVAVIMP
jgi:DNA replication protein DnaC